jgi:release factor glutamine methyltransferase
MKTILDILNLSADFLRQRGIQNPRRQAEELLSDVLGMGRMDLYLEFERPLTEPELDRCRKSLSRRGKREPLQYIHGEVDFYGCRLKVNSHVLIPRQETEILVDKICKELSTLPLEGKSLWDLCCGSGCIGIAIKKRFPTLKVALSDLSDEAIQVARQNAQLNEVEADFFQGDLLHPFKGQKVDFVVCNPPYVAAEEYEALEVEVRGYEPKMALVAGKRGIEFYERLAQELPDVLNPAGKVWLEIGHGQGSRVKELFDGSRWKRHELQADWAGLERFFSLEIE